MPIFRQMITEQPQLTIFLGDNIYADTTDMQIMQAKYDLLRDDAGFSKLIAACPTLATWEDHDYGLNDAGADYEQRVASQRVFLDFWSEPLDSERRSTPGVYSASVYGPVGKRLQVTLLDTRYFRGPLAKGERRVGGPYKPTEDKTIPMLGDAQWRWLEQQLQTPAEVRVLCSSYQLLPDEHGSEAWGNFPLERKRLLHLIRDTKAKGAIVISGDRHLAEMMRLAPDATGIGYPLYEVTSSSLNAPSGNFTKAGVRFANEINSYRVGLTYFDTNFGFIDIDWSQPSPLIRLQVRDEKGGVLLQQRVQLSDLQ